MTFWGEQGNIEYISIEIRIRFRIMILPLILLLILIIISVFIIMVGMLRLVRTSPDYLLFILGYLLFFVVPAMYNEFVYRGELDSYEELVFDVYLKSHTIIRFAAREGKRLVSEPDDRTSSGCDREDVINQVRQANEHADRLLNSSSTLEEIYAGKEKHPFDVDSPSIDPSKDHHYEHDCSVCGATDSIWYTKSPDTGPLLKCESCGALWDIIGPPSEPEDSQRRRDD